MCVCVRERERERRGGEGEEISRSQELSTYSLSLCHREVGGIRWGGSVCHPRGANRRGRSKGDESPRWDQQNEQIDRGRCRVRRRNEDEE